MTRIAMIGGGPKCLYALLELNDLLDPRFTEEIRVDVYDPYPPGAGRVWNIKQPRELRLNVNSRIIDASSSLCEQDFNQWRAARRADIDEAPYPARAQVGEYLSDQFDRLVLEGKLKITHRPLEVSSLARNGVRWNLTTEDGTEEYDEVVLCTGHGVAGYRSADTPEGAVSAAALTVERQAGAAEAIDAGSQVRIRGAALTAYDVVLTLTEGRGGTWEEASTDGMSTLHYQPSGREPAKITLTSPSGIPMSPKPLKTPHELHRVLETYRERIRSWGKDQQKLGAPRTDTVPRSLDSLWKIIVSCARECALRCGVAANEESLWKTALAGRSAEMSRMSSSFEQLRASLRCVRGVGAVSHEWIWGVVWAGIYAQLVDAVSRISWTAGERERFLHISANLERMAYGPPEPTALKLLALYERGILDQQRSDATMDPAEVLVDAVTAPPGVLAYRGSKNRPVTQMMGEMLAAGEVMIRPGERGLRTDLDGTCLNAQGARNESLTALGRPTEGPTLGHDTLNRNLHTEYRAWAQRITQLVSSQSQKVTT